MPNENDKTKTNGFTAFEDTDSFWELDALLPPRSAPPRRPADVETVEVSLGEKKESAVVERYGSDYSERRKTEGSVSERKYQPITASPTQNSGRIDYSAWLKSRRSGDRRSGISENDECYEYVPENPLLFRARIIHRKEFESLEEPSLADMRRMADKTANFEKNVEFTALFPQYSRMTEEQIRCYIGFRTEVLSGRFPQVSESYILFLLYEIINLTDKFPPNEAVKTICSLICAYSDCSDGLFTFMCDWLQDLCLINRLSAPFDLLEPVRERVYKHASWKEFYVPFKAETSEPDACVLLASASSYDYRTGKYYSSETAEYFDTHIPKAIGAAIRALSTDDPMYSCDDNNVTTLSHDAFRSAFRSAKHRYNVAIDCACFTRSPLLRQTVTSLVKYAENFVREMLGIRSRLSVSCLGTEKKELIKAYFAPFIKQENDRPPLKRGRKKKQVTEPVVPAIPEYEKYYEPQSKGFSAELAAKIESDSWATTDMLLSTFAEPDDNLDGASENADTVQYNAVNPVKTTGETLNEVLVSSKSASVNMQTEGNIEMEALDLLLCGKSLEFSSFARQKGLLPDTVAERINQIALDTYGDIAIEFNDIDGGFNIIEDYREELNDMVSSQKG